MNQRTEVDMERKIVIAYDGRPAGNDAVALGAELCGGLGARPVVASVAVFPTYLIEDPLELGMAVDEDTRPLIDEATRRLGRDDVEGRKLLDSSPARALHELAEQIEPVAMVLGSAHRDPLGRVRVGTTGKQLLTGATCPIAVAPPGFAEQGDRALKKISVAIDEHEESEIALAEASMIARRLGAGLKIVSVLQFPVITSGPLPGPAIADLDQIQTRYTAHMLEDAAARVPEGIPVQIEGMVGDPGKKLEEHSHECDLLAVGSRSHGPLRRVLLGSVSAHLAKSASCPLLITPRGSHDPAASLRRNGHRIAASA